MTHFQRALLILGLLIYGFAFQGARGLYERDEGRYAAVACQMLRLGNWIEPHLDEEHEHWTKPPVTYWAIASSMAVLGPSEFAVRAPIALGFLLTIGILYRMGRFVARSKPWLASAIYATTLFPFATSNMATTDVLLTMFSTAGMWAFMEALWGSGGRRRGPWLMAAGAFFGLAFLTKGPAVAIPGLALIGYTLIFRPKSRGSIGEWSLGILAFCMLAVPWFLVVISRHPQLGSYFVLDEVVGRAAGMHHRNAEWYGPLVIYGPVLLLGTLPWTYALAREARDGVRGIWHDARGYLAGLPDVTRFLLVWSGWAGLLLMLVRSRLPLYSLPIFPPMTLLLAGALARREGDWTPKRFGLLGLWMALLLAIRLGAAFVPSQYDARQIARSFDRIPADQYDEILFFGVRPARGLTFYLGKDIEEINAEELVPEIELEPDELRLWVVRERDVARLREAGAQAPGSSFVEAGEYPEGLLIFREVPLK